MVLESGLFVFAVGMAGGAANELLHWWILRENLHFPQYAKGFFYWIVTLAMILLGGVLALLQLGDEGNALVAFQIGLAAPMLLQKIIKAAPNNVKMSALPSPSLRDFLEG